METIIKNKQNEDICIEVLQPENPTSKLAFIGHGITSSKEEKAMEVSKEALLKAGYTVINIDFRYNFGKSQRGMEKASLNTFVEDFETVIEWAKGETFYTEPYTLLGHSMGALAATAVAANKKEEAKELILLTPPFEWEKAFQENRPENFAEFVQKGTMDRYNFFNPEDKDKLSINAVYSIKEQALEEKISQITADTLVITGSKDITAPTKYTKSFCDKLKAKCKSIEIKDCDHTFSTEESANKLSSHLSTWLKGKDENINLKTIQLMQHQLD